jgi:hypothetical protein
MTPLMADAIHLLAAETDMSDADARAFLTKRGKVFGKMEDVRRAQMWAKDFRNRRM